MLLKLLIQQMYVCILANFHFTSLKVVINENLEGFVGMMAYIKGAQVLDFRFLRFSPFLYHKATLDRRL